MKNIVLLCSLGMSTSILVKKMQEYADSIGFECSVKAFPIADAEAVGKEADIVLLGPQVRFQLDRIKSLVSCPVDVIDLVAYGRMNGEAVIKKIQELLI